MNPQPTQLMRAVNFATATGRGITLLSVLALIALSSAASVAAPIPEMSMSGEITAIGDNSLTVEDSDLKKHTVSVDDSTTYTLDGEEALFSSLKVGHSASVIVTQDGENWRAKSVTATSRLEDFVQ